MTIQQTMEIPADRKIQMALPEDIPAGGAQAPAPNTDFSCLIDPNIPTPHTDFLSGILAGAGGITREQIREERLRTYLQ
jgi:hypothetical protein